MMITSYKKQKPQFKDENLKKLIDSAGETQFKNIFTKMKDEVKNTIITKLLSKLEKQQKQIEQYKQEIISLKNDLTYILKRVLLLKDQIPYSKNNLNKNYRTATNSKKYIFNLNKNINSNSLIFNLNNSSTNVLTESNINTDRNNTPRNMINNYLNSIYKNNLIHNSTGIGSKFLLGKKDNLYKEIFLSNDKNISEDIQKNKTYQKSNNRSHENIFINVKRKIMQKEKILPMKEFPASILNSNYKNYLKNDNFFKSNTKIVKHNNNLSLKGIRFGNKFEKDKSKRTINAYSSPYLINKI